MDGVLVQHSRRRVCIVDYRPPPCVCRAGPATATTYLSWITGHRRVTVLCGPPMIARRMSFLTQNRPDAEPAYDGVCTTYVKPGVSGIPGVSGNDSRNGVGVVTFTMPRYGADDGGRSGVVVRIRRRRGTCTLNVRQCQAKANVCIDRDWQLTYD